MFHFMYYASLITRKGLFAHLGGWVKQAREEEKVGLDEFLFRATSAVLALDEMHFHHRCCLEDFRRLKTNLTLVRPKIILWSPQLFPLFHHFSPFLSSMRFLQNMVLPMVTRRLQLRRSVPMSLNDAMPKIQAYGLPTEIVDLLQAYWDTGGKELKDYRDLDQHYFALCDHTFLQWSPEERVIILLPDDPTVRTEATLTFTKQTDALAYFVRALNQFHECIERISFSLGFRPTQIQEQMDMNHLGTLDEGVRQTLALWVDDCNTGSAMEIGQTEDRRVYVRQIQPSQSTQQSDRPQS
jgi:hypothetical protein